MMADLTAAGDYGKLHGQYAKTEQCQNNEVPVS